jgi:hypothetical protein
LKAHFLETQQCICDGDEVKKNIENLDDEKIIRIVIPNVVDASYTKRPRSQLSVWGK